MGTTLTQHTSRFGNSDAGTSGSSRTAEAVSERILLDRCKAGDRDAWHDLIRRYETSIYNYAFSLCHNYDETGDIVGQVFLRLYQYLRTFRSEASFNSWLFRVAHNTYLDLCIRPPHRRFLSLDAGTTGECDGAIAFEATDPAPTPEQICMENETRRLLNNAICHLPTYQMQVLSMYHSGGKSYDEIAVALGLSVGTVKSRLNRARNALRERRDSYEGVTVLHIKERALGRSG